MKWLQPGLLATACLFFAACQEHLPGELHGRIAQESKLLRSADQEWQRVEKQVQTELSQNASLFRDVSTPGEWTLTLRKAKETLHQAAADQQQLEELARNNRKSTQPQAEKLLAEERKLRADARQSTQRVETAARQWLAFSHDPTGALARLKQRYDQVHSLDLAPVTTAVEKAEQDWPKKKSELEKRLSALQSGLQSTTTQWDGAATAREAAAAGSLDSQGIEALVRVDQALSRQFGALTEASSLQASSQELYNSWDKVLTDLDTDGYGSNKLYRERVRTVQTHFLSGTEKKGETTSSENWINVPESSYRSLENNLGMTIAHKDVGLFDGEADTTPQPPGFAYIAPASQERNQYGYWSHTSHGSVWTFLPEYLIMRELLWNQSYRPVVIEDFNAYRTAKKAGRIYYGQQTPASTPQYGTHGSFTQTRYAQSRYAQSGGFKSSAYASHPVTGNTPSFNRPSTSKPSPSFGINSGSSGKRFGSPSGQRFGRSNSSRSAGRSFGRRR